MSESRDTVSPSWLALEQHALGELSPDREASLSRALERDPESAAIARRIRADHRPLPPLPEPAPGPAAAPGIVARFLERLRDWRVATGATLALAGATVLVLWLATAADDRSPDTAHAKPDIPGPRLALVLDTSDGPDRHKGGDIIISLVRERAGAITMDPTSYRDGDRFKVLLTCPTGPALHGDIAVYQGAGQSSETSFPLARIDAPLACGNRVALPGAFQLSGPGDAHVCLVFATDEAPARQSLEHRDAIFQARDRVVCASLGRED